MKSLVNQATEVAIELASELESRNCKVVFAESCTAGLVSATLAQIAGISNYLCGSAVTYRPATKAGWLGVAKDILAAHSAESETVTDMMAIEVLAKTPEADWSAAVTGHLGPGAPDEKDGVVFISIAMKLENKVKHASSARFKLACVERSARQLEAAIIVLNQLRIAITSNA